MNWNWACEQLLKGKKVRRASFVRKHYVIMKYGIVASCVDIPITLSKDYMTATDWELYQKEKWTEEDIREAKHGISLGFKWVARDGDGVLCWYKTKPTKYNGILKGDGSWCPSQRISSNYDYIDNHLFYSVKWEDAEPTRLIDIANSEVQDADM